MQNPLKFGHRGAKGHLAENTIASIEKAIELGVDGIEIDVHRCASGELVVFHDFTLERMTNGFGDVSQHTLSQLKALKVSSQFTIPTLVEVLDVIDKKCVLNIELKGKDTATETCKLIDAFITYNNWKISDFLISSFDLEELKKARVLNENLRLGVLTEKRVPDILEFSNTVNAYSLNINYEMIDRKDVKLAHDNGLKIFVWTVNNIKSIELMKKYDVDAIISDVPDCL
ncbi:glycerophosphodiester phosphodiesterase [Psychroserpens sp. Hel_I_66]|uniref:glycerophosphodiester phosphodiesterase n=1 Tax=Psychroserpens sp. Hel_I_66 TaxID=1250004 RepID=UPI000647AFFE|nr:glycerophosphodiester phosphodiesterase family protein [Psychroserpens sp. Hel_I_66]